MEIEFKLRLPATAVPDLLADPLLAGVKSARKRLDNIYFDTPAFDLAQAKTSLRLRKDGLHWLQTVKSGGSASAGLHQRHELEFPVARRALDWAPLAGTPFANQLGPFQATVAAQFRTRFDRQLWLLCGPTGAKIELAIDQGHILAGKAQQSLCEVELELKSGPVDDLFAIALALSTRHPMVLDNRSKAQRGNALARQLPLAPPVKATDTLLPDDAGFHAIAHAAVANCLAQWQANQDGYLAQAIGASAQDTEYLHQLRVGVRRLRVACDPLARGAGWQTGTLANLKKPLRQLGQQLGAARDWDVFAEETWPALVESIKTPALRMALQEEIQLQRSLAHLQAHAALGGRAVQHVLLQLSRCLSQPTADTTPPTDLYQQLGDYAQTLQRGVHDLHHLPPESLHALRIVAKKMRYLTEFIASRHAEAYVEPWLKWLKKTQEVLGTRNDRTTAQLRITQLCSAIPAHHGKVRRALQGALKAQPLAALDLSMPPAAYWL